MKNNPDLHWSKYKERGSVFGIEILVFIHKYLGNWLFKIILFPVMVYFYITGRVARESTQQYLTHLHQHTNNQKLMKFQLFTMGFKVFYNFGLAIVDKFDAWLGKIEFDDIDVDEQGYKALSKTKGVVIISAHLGNMEICRAIFGTGNRTRPLNIITYNEHTPSFNDFLKKVNKDAAINFIYINQFGPADSIILKQKIEDGEAVIIFADRTSVNHPGSTYEVPFLGEKAPFAKGPFALASLMECPVFLMFCTKEKSRFKAHVEEFASPKKVKRKERDEYYQFLATKFAERLGYYCTKAPYQWYNFFNFWASSQANVTSSKNEEKDPLG